MYLSKIVVPKAHIERLGLDSGDIEREHALITRGLNAREPRYLFRTERGLGGLDEPIAFLLQTHMAPELGALTAEGLTCESRQFEPSFRIGQHFRFKARLNTCICTSRGAPDAETWGGRHVRSGLGGEERQVKWLDGMALARGFEVEDASALDERVVGGKRHGLVFRSVVFEGIISVVDVAKFDHAFRRGVGHGKAFGFGLISPAKAI